MRTLFILLAAAAAFGPRSPQTFADELEPPYTAYVAQDDVVVRSGPGGNYYSVQTLQRGETVRVLRQDPGGWLAIEPPADSFDWVAADFIEPRQKNIGVVTGNRVALRMGSTFGKQRDVIADRLYEGDEVRLLDPRKHTLGPKDRQWYKVAPLDDELRWISKKHVSQTLAEPDPLPVAESEADNDADVGDLESALAADDETVRLAAHEERAAAEPPARSAWKKRTRKRAREPRTADARSRAVESPVAMAAVDSTLPRRLASASISELNLALSAMVAGEPQSWNFDGIRPRAKTLLHEAHSAAERREARELVKQIDRFSAIHERWKTAQASDAPPPVDSEAEEPTGSRASSETDIAAADAKDAAAEPSTDEPAALGYIELEQRYDGVGQLTEVVTKRAETPRFALLDSRGAARMYLTPAPGVNLRRLIGRKVGVTGRLGYLPEMKAQHIAVQRATRLD